MTPLKLIEFKKLDNKIIKNRKFKEKKKVYLPPIFDEGNETNNGPKFIGPTSFFQY